MASVLITGGLGFIGHNVVSKLENIHNVIIVDNETDYGYPVSTKKLIADRKKQIKNSKIYNVDIVDAKYLDWILASYKIDVIIHLASFSRAKLVEFNPLMASRTMIEGTINLCELAKKHKVKKLVYISSSMVYGDFTDDTKETHNCNPKGTYGILKLAGENLVKDYSTRGCFDHVIIRPSAVYGPLDMEDRIVTKFILSAMHGSDLKVNGINEHLDFTYVEDLAQGIAGAAISENTNNKTYNLTRGKSRSILDAANLVVQLVGKGNVNINDKDVTYPSRGALNIDAACRDFGYDPKIDIEEGFQQVWLRCR